LPSLGRRGASSSSTSTGALKILSNLQEHLISRAGQYPQPKEDELHKPSSKPRKATVEPWRTAYEALAEYTALVADGCAQVLKATAQVISQVAIACQ